MIDHATFRNSEIDALYGEIDEEASAAMDAHAAACADCAARFERLKKTRGLVLSVAVETVPDDFESRIMSAVDAGLAKRASVIPIGRAATAAAAAAPKVEGGANVLRLLSRPSFAVAATFVLVIGAGALILARSGSSLKSLAANDESPAMQAVPAVNGAAAPAASGAGALAEANAVATATAAPVVLPPPAAGAVARSDDGDFGGFRRSAAPAAKPAAIAAPAADPVAAAAPAARKAPAAKTGSLADDRAFAAAKALYDDGRFADALPRFEALAASNPEADLYAARCIARTRGCAAAEPRYDSAARTNAGTAAGSRAQLEGARCYQSTGDVVAARKRYQAAKDEGTLETEASKALDDLDHTGGGPGGAGGAHAAPKAAAPREMAPQPAPASPPANR